MITSTNAHELVIKVLKKQDISFYQLSHYSDINHKNPFEGFVGVPGVCKAYHNYPLSTTIRKKFQKYVENVDVNKLKPAMKEEEIYKKVRQILKKEKISSPNKIKRNIVKNPFEGFVGTKAVYKAWSRAPLKRETRKSFERFFQSY